MTTTTKIVLGAVALVCVAIIAVSALTGGVAAEPPPGVKAVAQRSEAEPAVSAKDAAVARAAEPAGADARSFASRVAQVVQELGEIEAQPARGDDGAPGSRQTAPTPAPPAAPGPPPAATANADADIDAAGEYETDATADEAPSRSPVEVDALASLAAGAEPSGDATGEGDRGVPSYTLGRRPEPAPVAPALDAPDAPDAAAIASRPPAAPWDIASPPHTPSDGAAGEDAARQTYAASHAPAGAADRREKAGAGESTAPDEPDVDAPDVNAPSPDINAPALPVEPRRDAFAEPEAGADSDDGSVDHADAADEADASARQLPIPSGTPAADEATTSNIAPPTGRRYTLKPGDTFIAISIKLYGSERFWRRIAGANPGVDARRLQPGDVINLPPLDAAADDPGESPAAAAKVGAPRSHTIQPGESLWAISKKHYDTGDHWRHIYEANREVIGANPGRLRAGATLSIPPAPK